MRARSLRFLSFASLALVFLSFPTPFGGQAQQEAGAGIDAAVDDRYHFSFPIWSDQVVRFSITTEPGSDFKLQESQSVLRTVHGGGDGVVVHFQGSVLNGNLHYAFFQFANFDDPIVEIRAGDAAFRTQPLFHSEGGLFGIEYFGWAHFWRGGTFDLYYATYAAPGELYLNLTGTHGLIDHNVTVLEGAHYLKPADLEGVTVQANAYLTAGGVTAGSRATITTDGPSMGHFGSVWSNAGSCTAPDGRDCYEAPLLVSDPGDWWFVIDREVRADTPMWYVGAVLPV